MGFNKFEVKNLERQIQLPPRPSSSRNGKARLLLRRSCILGLVGIFNEHDEPGSGNNPSMFMKPKILSFVETCACLSTIVIAPNMIVVTETRGP